MNRTGSKEDPEPRTDGKRECTGFVSLRWYYCVEKVLQDVDSKGLYPEMQLIIVHLNPGRIISAHPVVNDAYMYEYAN